MPDDTQNSTDQKLADRFRGMAEVLDRHIEQKRNPGVANQNPTPRRIRMAEQMARDADRLEELQQCLTGMAGDLEQGTLPDCLSALKTKVHIEAALNRGRRATQEDGSIAGLSENDLAKYTALRAYITGPSAEDQAARRLQELENSLVGVKIPGFFPTPPEMVAELVKLARPDLLEFVARVLEPSAGKGDIADALRTKCADLRLDCCEINHTLREVLKEKGHSIVAQDFLAYEPGQVYDLIVMNPPFEKAQDAEHVRHAFDLLKAGGRLVAIVSEGLFFRQDRKATDFREWLELHGAEESERIQDAFKNGFRSTGVTVRIVTATKTERDVRLLDAERVDLNAVNPGWMSLARALGHEPKRDYYLEWYWKRRSEWGIAFPDEAWSPAAPGEEVDTHPPAFTKWLQTWNPKDKPTLDPTYVAPAAEDKEAEPDETEAETVAMEQTPGCKGCGRPVEKSWGGNGICHTCLNQMEDRIHEPMATVDEMPAEAQEVVHSAEPDMGVVGTLDVDPFRGLDHVAKGMPKDLPDDLQYFFGSLMKMKRCGLIEKAGGYDSLYTLTPKGQATYDLMVQKRRAFTDMVDSGDPGSDYTSWQDLEQVTVPSLDGTKTYQLKVRWRVHRDRLQADWFRIGQYCWLPIRRRFYLLKIAECVGVPVDQVPEDSHTSRDEAFVGVVPTTDANPTPNQEDGPVQSEPDTPTVAAAEPATPIDSTTDAPPAASRVFRDIPLADIIPSPNNKRHLPDARSLDLGCEILREYLEGGEVGAHNGLLDVAIWRDLYELAKSIRGQGLAQPGVARPAPDPEARAAGKVELCCGHRRLVAHRIAGLPTMLVSLRDLDDRQAAELTSVENLQRSDLTPLEEGEQIAVLLEKGWDVETVATHIGKTPSWVYRRAQVAKLTPEWREAAGAVDSPFTRWSAGHYEQIARLPENVQNQLLSAISGSYWERNNLKTVSDLYDYIGDQLRTLESAQWALSDAELLPAAGACSMCPKRSGCQPTLFAEQETDGKDHCLDPGCWNQKVEAHIARRVTEVQEEYGDEVSLGHTIYGKCETWPAAKQVEAWRISETKKKDHRPVLMVEGKHAGHVVWLPATTAGRKVDANGKVKPLTLAERRKGLQHKRDAWAVTHVAELLLADDSEPKKFWDDAPLADMLALVAGFGTASSSQYLAKVDHQSPYRWEAFDAAATLDPYEAVLAVWKSIRHKLNETLAFDTQVTASNRVDAAKRVCDLLQVDWDAIVAKAEAECPEPKSWAKLNADGTPKTAKTKGKKRAAKAEKGEVA